MDLIHGVERKPTPYYFHQKRTPTPPRSDCVSVFFLSSAFAAADACHLCEQCAVQTTLGPDRLPPNHFPALLYTTTPPLTSTAVSSLVLEPAASRKTGTTRIEVPNVPHAFLLADVLSLDECEAIVKSAEAVGFAEDAPVGDSIKGESILAHVSHAVDLSSVVLF